MGTINGTNAYNYTINYGNDNFGVTSAGVVVLAKTLTTGIYSATLTATGTSGGQSAVPVTVFLTCSS